MESSTHASYKKIDEFMGDNYINISTCDELRKSLNEEKTEIEFKVSKLFLEFLHFHRKILLLRMLYRSKQLAKQFPLKLKKLSKILTTVV